MPKNKLSELASSLTIAEQKQFLRYLESPYFQCDSTLIKFFKGITREEFSHATGNKKKHFDAVYPGKRYNEKQLRYLVSDLNRHLTHFITLKHLQSDDVTFGNLTAMALSKRDCEKAYNHVHQLITKNNSVEDASHYLHQFTHAELHLTYSSGKLKRKETPDFTSTLHNLDIFYLSKKLQLNCEVVNLSNILQKNYTVHLSDEISQLSRTEPFNSVPVINIYYHILESLLDPGDESHFTTAADLLRLHGHRFHPGELGDMYQYIRNYCVRKLNQGNTAYVRRLYDIYLTMLSNKTLMRHDFLSQWEFKNIVSISLRLNEKKWCTQFIERYINYLKPSERKNALTYNTAYYLFMNNEYRKAIRKLQEVELTDVYYQLDARVILLKCYYELDEYDTFVYHASAFRLFLLRNRTISEYQKTINRNLIKFLSAIMRSGYSRLKLVRIRAEIEKEKNVADLNWLMSKIDAAIPPGPSGNTRQAHARQSPD